MGNGGVSTKKETPKRPFYWFVVSLLCNSSMHIPLCIFTPKHLVLDLFLQCKITLERLSMIKGIHHRCIDIYDASLS